MTSCGGLDISNCWKAGPRGRTQSGAEFDTFKAGTRVTVATVMVRCAVVRIRVTSPFMWFTCEQLTTAPEGRMKFPVQRLSWRVGWRGRAQKDDGGRNSKH